eukprot:TRINITY_DN20102_c0_g1_i2.p1 TRINITY_DN20102_c0_g1~~TRINITY_DN20102_c0_g1_i2.p1  ORF type:complete len:104 (+),score=24.59 TRINITY_DN20102_c0_g1_i2:137-448(+)
MIRRPPRSTQGVSSAASDVYKRQVHGESKNLSKLKEIQQIESIIQQIEMLGTNNSNSEVKDHVKKLREKVAILKQSVSPDEDKDVPEQVSSENLKIPIPSFSQ